MGSSQRVIPQAELEMGFGLLKDIIAMVKDPASVEAVHRAAREQAALTEAEISKANTARKVVENAAEITRKAEMRHAEIDDRCSKHAQEVAAYRQHFDSEDSRLRNWQAGINAAASDLKNAQQKLEADLRAFESSKTAYVSEHNRKMNELSEKINETERLRKTLEQEGREIAKKRSEQENREAEMLRIVTGK